MYKMSEKAIIYRMVSKDHTCPFGIKSKRLLERKGYVVEDIHLESKQDAQRFKEKNHVKTTPQTFIGEERIGGYEDLKTYFNENLIWVDPFGKYQPIIAVLIVTALLTLAICYQTQNEIVGFYGLKTFVAFTMAVLGILKLQNLTSFQNQFITYDVLGRQIPSYARIYPFVEVGSAILMLASILPWLAAPAMLFTGGIGAFSVIKAVYVDKRNLKCACVGGGSELPLGAVSLTENLMMLMLGMLMINNL